MTKGKSYLKRTNKEAGVLINLNMNVPGSGIQGVVNEFPESQRALRTQR
jgi:hypothetical protein